MPPPSVLAPEWRSGRFPPLPYPPLRSEPSVCSSLTRTRYVIRPTSAEQLTGLVTTTESGTENRAQGRQALVTFMNEATRWGFLVVANHGGLVVYLATLYCGPVARTGKGRGREGAGLYPELAALGIIEGSSPALVSLVGRQCASAAFLPDRPTGTGGTRHRAGHQGRASHRPAVGCRRADQPHARAAALACRPLAAGVGVGGPARSGHGGRRPHTRSAR